MNPPTPRRPRFSSAACLRRQSQRVKIGTAIAWGWTELRVQRWFPSVPALHHGERQPVTVFMWSPSKPTTRMVVKHRNRRSEMPPPRPREPPDASAGRLAAALGAGYLSPSKRLIISYLPHDANSKNTVFYLRSHRVKVHLSADTARTLPMESAKTAPLPFQRCAAVYRVRCSDRTPAKRKRSRQRSNRRFHTSGRRPAPLLYVPVTVTAEEARIV